MAVMATEQPQPVSVDQKINNDVAPEKDKMAVDEPVAEVADDTAKLEETPTTNGQPSDIATAANQEAFAANNGLSTKSPAESPQAPATEDSEMKDATEPKEPLSTDSEMKDVNGSKESASTEKPAAEDVNGSKESVSTEKPAAEDVNGSKDSATTEKPVAEDVNGSQEEASTEKPAAKEAQEESSVQAPASPPKSATPKPSTSDDAMDLDESVEQHEEKASNEEADKTQATSTASDKGEPTSPQEISQTADVAKLDIKSPQQDTQDVPMADQPTPTGKVSRERSVDEDGEDEPLAKRTKLDSSSAKPSPSAADKASAEAGPEANTGKDDIQDDQPIKEHHSKEMRKELARVKKTKNGMNFRQPVEKLWPGIWESYKAMIDDPVDLALFEHKFRDNKYSTFGEFKADLRLLNANALKFNGANNPVSIAASRVSTDLLAKWSEISKMPEPAKAEKGKPQPTRHVESRAATQPRRQSQSQAAGTATSPKPKKIDTTGAPSASATTPVSTAAPAFALPPNGVPQIRRDSTRDDADRPKRPIHPPKNRDPDYGAQNARKKKLEPEMRFYAGVLEDLKKGKYWAQNQWFLAPVDPVALNIPNYFQVVKKPMDLKTMTEKLEDGKYRSGKDVEKDMRQIVANSELFNGPSHVTQCAQDLENLFKEKVAEKANWMAKNYPPSAPSVSASAPSPEASEAESEDESEAEADENSESVRNVQSRLSEEQVKLNDMLAAKKPDMTMIEVQQNVVSLLQRKLVEEKSKVGGTKKAKPPKKAASKSKSKSGASQTTAGSSNKKAAGGGSSSSKNRPAPKKPQSKKRTIGTLEKQVITEGISELDGPTLDKAVEIIKRDTNQKEDDDGQLELDIEVLSQDALGRLFELINKAYPNIYAQLSKKPEFSKDEKRARSPAQPSNPSKPKKNKPMNKDEQERKIEQLRELKAQFQRQGSGSQEPAPEDEEKYKAGNSSEESDSEEE